VGTDVAETGDSDDEIDLTRVICPLHELDDPGARGFTLGAGEWPLRGFVVRRGQAVRAYVNHCPHAGFPLNWQPNVFLAPGNGQIRCIMHGALFEIETGDCVAGPCMGHGLQSIPIVLRDGYVLLEAHVPLEDPN
jgi:nitrite reductase/ring-hydroxylating ferredoxin subunit